MAVAPKSAIKKVLEEIVKEKELVSSSVMSPVDDSQQAAFRRYPMDDDAPSRGTTGQIVNIVNYILSNAIKERASDIHIESQVDRLRVRYRIDGKLIYRTDLPKYLMDPIIRRLKVMARMDITEIRDTQEGRIFISYNKQDIDLRVSLFTTVLGGAVTIRLLTKELGLRDLEDLGMLPRVLKTLKLILDSPSGLILFTGPTGCGKTTSLYACLNYLNTWNVKIVTLEDPVEYSIEGISQCQVKSMKEGIIAERVKAMMHQDPDVMVIGEISNEATAYGAIQTALTGHMVCSTIHTDDSIGAVLRLLDSGLRTFLLSSTSMAILSQRLVRKICSKCRERYSPSVEIVKEFHIKNFDPDQFEFYRGKGCAECNYTGYFGRSGAFELLAMNDEIRSAFLQNKNAAEIRRLAYKTGKYISLRETGFIKALQHISTLEEGIGVLSYSERESFATIDLTFQEIQRWSGIEIEKEEVSTPERTEVKQPTSKS
jgi:type IV pilus assembly protein PilB